MPRWWWPMGSCCRTGGLGGAQARLLQHPCLLAAALARRGTDPARHPRRRPGKRHHHHEDGRRPRYRAHGAAAPFADRRRHHRAKACMTRLSALGAETIVEALARLAASPGMAFAPQPEAGVTYAAKLSKAEGRLDWRETGDGPGAPGARLLRPGRGPGFSQDDLVIKVLRSRGHGRGSGAPGALLDDRLTVACGTGALRLTEVQRPGKRPMTAEDFPARLRPLPAAVACHAPLQADPGIRRRALRGLAAAGQRPLGAGGLGSGGQGLLRRSASSCKGPGAPMPGSMPSGRWPMWTWRARSPASSLRAAVNFHLKPAPIAVVLAERVPEDFHARFSAVSRSYLYRILNRRAPPVLLRGPGLLRRPAAGCCGHGGRGPGPSGASRLQRLSRRRVPGKVTAEDPRSACR